jgi:ABC-type Mn2+/Zn2+ transport system permease subunit
VTLLVHIALFAAVLALAVTYGSERKPFDGLKVLFGEVCTLYKTSTMFAIGFDAVRLARVTLLTLCLVFLTYDEEAQAV